MEATETAYGQVARWTEAGGFSVREFLNRVYLAALERDLTARALLLLLEFPYDGEGHPHPDALTV